MVRKWALSAICVVFLAGLAWWLWPRSNTISDVLPETTVSLVHLSDPDAVAQRLGQIVDGLDGRLGSLTPWLAKTNRNTALGFDAAQGFAAIGLGEQGAAMARLAGIEPGVLCLDLADRDRFSQWLTARAKVAVSFGPQQLKMGDTTLPLHAADPWVCLSRKDIRPAELTAAFQADARLVDQPLWAALNTRKSPSYAGWSARQATRWAHARQRTQLAGDLGHLAAYVAHATAHLDPHLHLAIHLTPEGDRLADQLFNASAPPRLSRWLARPGWTATRLSVALATAPEALATALPPSAPATQRQAISLGRMALPMTAGINWTQLTGALSGHVAVGIDVRHEGPKPPSILVLGVQDRTVAAKALKAVARKFGGGGGLFGMGDAKPQTIGGRSAWKLTFDSGPAWAHLAEDVIVVVSDPTLLTPPGSPSADPAWTLLDAPGTVVAVAGDLKAIGARLPKGAPVEGWPAQGGLAIRRAAPGLTLTTDGAPGVTVEALVQLGLWWRGQR